jgi:hypothetical protein
VRRAFDGGVIQISKALRAITSAYLASGGRLGLIDLRYIRALATLSNIPRDAELTKLADTSAWVPGVSVHSILKSIEKSLGKGQSVLVGRLIAHPFPLFCYSYSYTSRMV